MLLACAVLLACGKKADNETASSEKTVVEQELSSASDAMSSTKAEEAAADSFGAARETEAVSTKPCKVKKHAQKGKAMVTAEGRTISVPTTIEGLRKEGFTFSGDSDVLKPEEVGYCRVGYKGAFNNIRLTVKNMTADPLKVSECTILGVEAASVVRDPDLTLYGIPMGATWTDVLSTYGKPFSQTDPNEDGISSVAYQFGTDINSSRIVFVFFKNGNVIDATYSDYSVISK